MSNGNQSETLSANQILSLREFIRNDIPYLPTVRTIPKSEQKFSLIWEKESEWATDAVKEFWDECLEGFASRSFLTKTQIELMFWAYRTDGENSFTSQKDFSEMFTPEIRNAMLYLNSRIHDVWKILQQQADDDQMGFEIYRDAIERFKSSKNFWCFYNVEQIEYSPAEGGCFYDHYSPIACFPKEKFKSENEAKEYGREVFGLTFPKDRIDIGDGESREVNGYHSARPEADGWVDLESFPFESMTFEIPHYC